MPETQARTGYEVDFAFAIPPATQMEVVGEVTNITPPGVTRDAIDATHLGSPEGYKEFIAGMKEGGEASLTVNYVPSATDRLLAGFDAGRIRCAINFPAFAGSPAVTLTFTAIVTAWNLNDVVAADKMSATFTCKCSGRPVFALASGGS